MLLIAAPGCGEEAATVYVPGTGFREELYLTTGRGPRARLGVDEPLVLHASRRSGPWVVADETTLPTDACRVASLPPQLELEVAADVRWIVEPAGRADWNVEAREDGAREIRFDAPGTYRLTAESTSWCGDPFLGDTLIVDVVAKEPGGAADGVGAPG